MTNEDVSTNKLLRGFFIRTHQERTFRVDCRNAGVAKNTRFRAYNFARWARKNLVLDKELMLALEEVSITVEGTWLVGKLKSEYQGMKAIGEALGNIPEMPDIMTGEDAAAAQASLNRVMELLKEVPTEAQAKPVFDPYGTKKSRQGNGGGDAD